MCKNYFDTNEYGLQFYRATGEGKKPFAVICPGGGYYMVSAHNEGVPFAKRLNALGYSAFVLRYRVGSKAKCPAPLDDLACAVRHIIENADEYNVKTTGYSVWGSSAGGHLAGLFSSERICKGVYNLPQPSAVILVYPVITMGAISHCDSVKNFLGENPTDEEIKAASIENNVNSNYPPTFLWNALDDDCVNPQNGEIMKNALERYGVEYEFLQFKTGGHGIGLGIGTECEPWFDRAVAFWQKEV
ncbi:MAG: alpha/beta hydrolase [Eubacterium sp.]|nr:alpha/beta hydrolase [Eubacterium sp.]